VPGRFAKPVTHLVNATSGPAHLAEETLRVCFISRNWVGFSLENLTKEKSQPNTGKMAFRMEGI